MKSGVAIQTSNYDWDNVLKNNLVDYIAMDIKAPLDNYKKLTGWALVVCQDC